MQPNGSYSSDIAIGIFGWARAHQNYQGDDTSQSTDFSETLDSTYPWFSSRTIKDKFQTAWIYGWTDMPHDYNNNVDISQRHHHSTSF